MSLNITSAGTVRKLLDRWSVLCPGDPFLEFESEDGSVTSLTYGQMYERALRAAGLLNSLGVEPGDRVLVHMPNRAEFFDAWFGCAVLGAVMVPTNPLLTRAELSFEIAHSGVVVAITTPELEASVLAARAETDLTQVIATGADMDERLAAADGYRGEGPDDRDPAAILYTSGTTSRLPAVNTGIAHKDPGVGQVGAGLVDPPMAAFLKATEALATA